MTITGETMSTYVAMLKEWYTDKMIEFMVYKNAPFFAMLPKNPEIGGETYDVPIGYADPQAASTRFSVAQGQKTPTKTTKFQVTVKEEYSFAQISRKVIKSSAKDRGAFLPAVTPNVDGAFRSCKRNLCIQAFGGGTGSKAKGASIAGPIITLDDRWDTLKFQNNEHLQFDDVDGTGTYPTDLNNNGGVAKITDIDRVAGTITIADVDAGTIATLAGTEYVFRAGDYANVISGYQAWVPSTAPGATAFNGVDRTADVDMLGGIRFDGSAYPIKEALTQGMAECLAIGDGEADHIYMHPKQIAKLVDQLGAKVEFQKYSVTENIGFQGFLIYYDGGTARVFGDRYCPTTMAAGITLEDWELISMGPCPEIFDKGTDQEMLREASEDGYELRVGGYPELVCHAPGHSVNITLGAL